MLLLLAPGCAHDVVVIDRGQSVTEAAAPVISGSRKLLDDAAAANQEAKMELAVYDRSCTWPDVVLAEKPTAKALCGEPGEAFVDVRANELKPTITLIKALAAYVGGIDAIISEAPDDSGAALEQAHADLGNLLAIGAGLGGGNAPPLLNDEQLEAAKNLAGLIGTMLQQRRQADALRELEAQSPEVQQTIAKLESQLKIWSATVMESSLDTINIVYEQRAAALREKAGDDEYREFLKQWQGLRDRQEATQELPAQLSGALAALKTAHQDYLRIIENKNLTAADRQALAAVARKRLSEALSAIAGVVNAFL